MLGFGRVAREGASWALTSFHFAYMRRGVCIHRGAYIERYACMLLRACVCMHVSVFVDPTLTVQHLALHLDRATAPAHQHEISTAETDDTSSDRETASLVLDGEVSFSPLCIDFV